MALPSTAKLYVSQGGGFGGVAVSEVVGAGLVAATSTDLGGVLEGVAVADCVPAADGTSAGEQLNDLLASLRAAGVIAT